MWVVSPFSLKINSPKGKDLCKHTKNVNWVIAYNESLKGGGEEEEKLGYKIESVLYENGFKNN